MAKEKLLLISGAGMTAAAAPSLETNTLTNLVTSVGALIRNDVAYRVDHDNLDTWLTSQEYWPLAQILWEALRSVHQRPNFETYVHALEVLEPIAASRRAANFFGSLDDLRPVVIAFMDVLQRYEPFMRADILRTERLTVVLKIFEHITTIVGMTDFDQTFRFLGDFVARLSERFDLRVITLNYDDVLDCLLPDYSDGFTTALGGYGHFEPRLFLEHIKDPQLLIHLHGSIRYGYKTFEDGSAPEIVKFKNRDLALESVRAAIRSGEATRGQTAQGGAIKWRTPLISGFQKADKLMLSPSPFGYYFYQAVQELLTCQRVLVVGYGCRDPHLNTWIQEASRVHGSTYRVALVTKLHAQSRGAALMPGDATIREFLDALDPDGRSWPAAWSHVVHVGRRILTVLSGLPIDDDSLTRVIDFLQT